MVKGPVRLDQWKLARVSQRETIEAGFDPLVDVDGLTGATEVEESASLKRY